MLIREFEASRERRADLMREVERERLARRLRARVIGTRRAEGSGTGYAPESGRRLAARAMGVMKIRREPAG